VRIFLDSSVLVPSFTKRHIHFAHSRRLFLAAERQSTFCAAHSLAEAYSRLTGAPTRPKVSPAQGLLFLDEIESRLTTVALDGPEYREAIEKAAALGLAGGAIYDYLIAQCALKASADVIYTWDLKDFLRFGGEIAAKVRSPGQ